MLSHHERSWAHVVPAAAVFAALLLVGCTAGDPRFTEQDPAGFWVGLWHGMIAVITLIVGIFADTVEVYERSNSGGWYDLGFILGVTLIWGGSSHTAGRRRRSQRDREREREWAEIGRKVEVKLARKIREWAEAEPDEDWNLVGARAEDKLKQKVREWAEEAPSGASPGALPPESPRPSDGG